MKTSFILRLSPSKIAIADLTRISRDVYEINRINVPPNFRGQRHGRELLRLIIEEADANHITLRLLPLPSGGLGKKKLIQWYERHGFKYMAAIGWWVRTPL